MVTPKEKEIEKKELPKIITKVPEAEVRLKVIPKPVKVREEAREATTEAERNAMKVAQSFVDFYTVTFNKTPEGREFLANMKKNSQIGNLLFE